MNYLQFSFEIREAGQSDALIALLADAGFDGFEEAESSLKAFIPESAFDRVRFDEIVALMPVPYQQETIAPRNWNAQWEQGFEPVVVDDFVAVRAGFHPPVAGVVHELVITPKMSFGTGHHGTTYLVMREMRTIDFKDKAVFDFGTGTGVLAILAEKLGAVSVTAIDIDEWSINNTIENIEANGAVKIGVSQADVLPETGSYDILLANINLNVLVGTIKGIAAIVKPGGHVLLSGFLVADETQMRAAVTDAEFTVASIHEKQGWLCFHIIKNSPE